MALRWILFASVLVAVVAQSQGSWFNSFRRSLYRNIDNDNNYNNYGNGQYFGNAAYQREELADCSSMYMEYLFNLMILLLKQILIFSIPAYSFSFSQWKYVYNSPKYIAITRVVVL